MGHYIRKESEMMELIQLRLQKLDTEEFINLFDQWFPEYHIDEQEIIWDWNRDKK